jgi:hypothetical protein
MATAVTAVAYYTNISHALMREKPDGESEVVSDTYFSEQVEVIKEEGEWVQIKTCVDNYIGWVKRADVYASGKLFLSQPSDVVAKVTRCSAHLYGKKDTAFGAIITLPFESRLQVLKEEDRWIQVQLHNGLLAYVQKGDITLDVKPLDKKEMKDLSYAFLGLPYTWGGRSSFGYDCSGFVQMLYRQMEIFIPRDTKDQLVWDGFQPVALAALQDRDLIFFGPEKGKVTHVGMYLGQDTFIHATVAENQPWIRLSQLSSDEWSGKKRPYREARRLKC